MKKILAVASYEKQKYYLEQAFQALPASIQEEVRVLCVLLAQKLMCTFVVGFYEDGQVYFETVLREDDFNFDDIGAQLEIKEIYRKKKDLLASLSLWYRIYFTEEGYKLKQEIAEEAGL